MKYRVYRLDVDLKKDQMRIEQFLNNVEGEVVSIIPNVKPTFLWMGATARVDFLLIVVKTGE